MAKQKIYQTMQGKQIDIDLLRKRNELTPAVGNSRVNARGDELGPGGKIVKNRQDNIQAYYESPNAVSGEVVPDPVVEPPVKKPAEVAAKPKTRSTAKPKTNIEKVVEQEKLDEQDEWVEDDDGNFVQKGK
tara:strand:+ start:489 stop:881 length:393 start_codon:yes stop_codon:yes gene_type:complete